MVAKIKAEIEGHNIKIHKDDFELILLALASQKFVNETPPNGDALAMDRSEYNQAQIDMQSDIDDIYNQAAAILYKAKPKYKIGKIFEKFTSIFRLK